MGIYVDSAIGYDEFEILYQSEYFVDKSNIIRKFNKLLQKNKRYICISKPRRFGKSSIANMIIAYYSKINNERDKEKLKKIFDNLNISKEENIESETITNNTRDLETENTSFKKKKLSYEETQGKYHTIYLNFSDIKDYEKLTLNEYLSILDNEIMNELDDIFKIHEIKENIILSKYLSNLYCKTKEKFIFVIDEWDYIFEEDILFTANDRNIYVSYLNDLLKDKPYVAFAYMTGILTPAKGTTQSKLNFFTEYSMLEDNQYYEYFRFTEKEVHKLCLENKKLNYGDLEKRYNGYLSNTGEKIFNPLSITSALMNNEIRNYWTKTGNFYEVKNHINFNINGVKEEFLKLILHEKIKIKLRGYGADNKHIRYKNKNIKRNDQEKNNNEEMKNEMYSSMVVYGFLTYDIKKEEVFIPNVELFEKFDEVFKNNNDFGIYKDLISNSKKILEATLSKDTKTVCDIIKNIQKKYSALDNYYKHVSLSYVIQFAYIDAQSTHDIKKETKAGKGKADFIFYPKDKYNGTVIIIELKVGESANSAIQQIYDEQYYFGLKNKGYQGKVLLVGINFTKLNKEYSCIIEEYDESKNIKIRNNNTGTDEDNNNNNNSNEDDDDYNTNNNKRKRKQNQKQNKKLKSGKVY
ncbi:hypothetical protein H8356DRAFT_1373450 [Neocallimastix lanati (nom. inval.)]|uniref:AAA-ATPase-like domain-containing protein n=1 Tax=Neocallimastix californiae TaxID=1754190 RepID=A0A1Y2DDJ1_9FUNG|nr:hypothetical protein H8356DRAFT_1373450 [Neocallimastix sp. JGI-2020a]ORY57328.1 hypothetical protein LY90DRAFT_506478 [Neocallimastix californiae]|eukprot:ORY57328.1 hypothetical protein LY90DRAFT_506478 [Neocallimastix californiae]